ncbi:MAG TPA: hypothetical protein VIQ81_05290 [Gammaproteobacteria bacterium]
MINRILLLFSMIALTQLLGCAGTKTFPNAVRAGDTASVALGWQKKFLPHNTTVTITPETGVPVTLLPNDPAIRAIINLYPDPVSYMVVGTETLQDGGFFNYGKTYGDMVNNVFTDKDKDWYQTVAFIDMPASLPSGNTTIELTNDDGETASSMIEIIEGSGAPALFSAESNGPLTRTQMSSMERAFSYEVICSGETIPAAVEMTISHDAGTVYVVNPRGDLKNLNWTDDGSTLKVHMISTTLDSPSHIKDFKFYIAGGYRYMSLQLVEVQEVKAYDRDGIEVPGVVASIVSN